MKNHLKRFLQIGLPLLGAAVPAGLANHAVFKAVGSSSEHAAGYRVGEADGLYAGQEESRSWMQGLFHNYFDQALRKGETTK